MMTTIKIYGKLKTSWTNFNDATMTYFFYTTHPFSISIIFSCDFFFLKECCFKTFQLHVLLNFTSNVYRWNIFLFQLNCVHKTLIAAKQPSWLKIHINNFVFFIVSLHNLHLLIKVTMICSLHQPLIFLSERKKSLVSTCCSLNYVLAWFDVCPLSSWIY